MPLIQRLLVEDETLHIEEEKAEIVYNVNINKEGIGARCCLYCISGGPYLIRAKYGAAFKILAASLAARS